MWKKIKNIYKSNYNIYKRPRSQDFERYQENGSIYITKPKIFNLYCLDMFKWIDKCYDYCNKNKMLNNKNMRLPVFMVERFTSFWFHNYFQVDYLPYAVLNKYYTTDYLNKFYNTLKTPYSFRNFPTKLDI